MANVGKYTIHGSYGSWFTYLFFGALFEKEIRTDQTGWRETIIIIGTLGWNAEVQ